MRKIRIAQFRNSKAINISMFIIAAFSFIISIIDFSVIFAQGQVAVQIKTLGLLSSALAIIPITWAACLTLVIKTRKDNFARTPSYIICALIAIAFVIYYVIYGKENMIRNILLFSVAILAIYPFIIATLTLEGRLYNRVFAIIFASILLALSVIGAIVLYVISSSVSLSLLIPACTYAELLLIILNYELVKPKKKNIEELKTQITH